MQPVLRRFVGAYGVNGVVAQSYGICGIVRICILKIRQDLGKLFLVLLTLAGLVGAQVKSLEVEVSPAQIRHELSISSGLVPRYVLFCAVSYPDIYRVVKQYP